VFYLVTHYKCHEQGGKYEFYQDIIKQVFDQVKCYPYYDVTRQSANDRLKDFRIRGKALKKTIKEINYIYYDNAGRKYAITTEASFIESLCNNDILTENYKEMNEYLQKTKYKYLTPELDALYESNLIYVDEIEVVKSIDNLVELINQNANQNGNNKKDKRKGITKALIQHNDAS
jgi:hypothetical protein